jgi:nucleoside-diphosphate-sugar epimerase
MKVLVTGAGGLIGRHLAARLVRDGHEVRAMVRPDTANVPAELRGAELARGDVTRPADVDRAVDGRDWVFHLAANVSHGSDKAAIWPPNVEGTRHVAEAALRAGVRRLVFTSSASVYGRNVARRDLSETSPPQPDSTYGDSKLAAEALLLDAHRKAGLPVVMVRTSNVVAPGAVAWLELARSVARGQFRMAGRGQGLHTLTDIDDFLDGLLLCAEVPGVEGEVFVMTGPDSLTLRAWMDAMAAEAGLPPPPTGWPEPLLRAYAAGDRISRALTGRRLPKADRLDFFLGDRSFDISKARRMLGYAPTASSPQVARRLMRDLAGLL